MSNTNKKTSKKKSRAWVYTIHNYTQKDLKRFHKLAEVLDKHKYICYGLEVGEKGESPHIQGYVQMRNACQFQGVQKYFNFTKNGELVKFYCAIAKAEYDKQKEYTGKEGDWREFGEPEKQGQRNDLVEIKNAVEEAPHDTSRIVRELGNNYQQVKYIETLGRHYSDFIQRNPEKPPIVYWVFGSSGVGKTRMIYDTFAEICSVSMFKWPGTGYRQQECLLFDDFREGDMSFQEVLKITDRYPHMLEKKGSEIPLNSAYIVFTSPYSVELTFRNAGENLKQLERRVIQIDLDKHMLHIDKINLKDFDCKFQYKGDEIDF